MRVRECEQSRRKERKWNVNSRGGRRERERARAKKSEREGGASARRENQEGDVDDSEGEWGERKVAIEY